MYDFTALYLYKAIFMCELLVAEFLMCTGLKRRPLFALRVTASAAACVGVAFALPVVAYNAIYCTTVFLLMFAVTLPFIALCYECNAPSAVFRGIAAYTTQHIAYQTFDLVMSLISLLFGNDSFATGGAYGDAEMSGYLPLIMYRAGTASIMASTSPMRIQMITLLGYCSYAFIYIATYALSCRFVSSRLKNSDKFEFRASSLFVFVVLFVLFNVVVTSVVTYSGEQTGLFVTLLISGYNIVCCLLTMYLMCEVIFKKQLELNYTTANRMLKQAEEQYALAKENIELINLKCHDLKHQIRMAGKADGGAVREIEDMIAIYDSNIRTGNEALDIILTEKSLYCNNRRIKLYCIVDGALLSFMSDPDLYSLFGNLLDNAIEAVEELPEDKRFVNLSVKKVNGFTRIETNNCTQSAPVFENGLPVTTKQDRDAHGYGMKSIRLICRKYGGEMLVSAADGLFTVTIIFI